MVYTCLFGTGKLLLHQPAVGLVLLVVSAICAFLLYQRVVRNFAVESQEPEGSVPNWVETPIVPGH
jgi:hypothetical protein